MPASAVLSQNTRVTDDRRHLMATAELSMRLQCSARNQLCLNWDHQCWSKWVPYFKLQHIWRHSTASINIATINGCELIHNQSILHCHWSTSSARTTTRILSTLSVSLSAPVYAQSSQVFGFYCLLIIAVTVIFTTVLKSLMSVCDIRLNTDIPIVVHIYICLLYTSDAADE